MKGYKPGYIVPEITVEAVLAEHPGRVWYGMTTRWWTHRPEHLCRKPNSGLPCDPRGGVLLETSNVAGFFKEALRDIRRYGRHGKRAFEAAHHQNCRVSPEDLRSTCFTTWREYQDAIERTDKFNRHRGPVAADGAGGS